MSILKKSNNKHQKLHDEYYQKNRRCKVGDKSAFDTTVKAVYHRSIVSEQNRRDKLLTWKQKRDIYELVYDYLNRLKSSGEQSYKSSSYNERFKL